MLRILFALPLLLVSQLLIYHKKHHGPSGPFPLLRVIFEAPMTAFAGRPWTNQPLFTRCLVAEGSLGGHLPGLQALQLKPGGRLATRVVIGELPLLRLKLLGHAEPK